MSHRGATELLENYWKKVEEQEKPQSKASTSSAPPKRKAPADKPKPASNGATAAAAAKKRKVAGRNGAAAAASKREESSEGSDADAKAKLGGDIEADESESDTNEAEQQRIVDQYMSLMDWEVRSCYCSQLPCNLLTICLAYSLPSLKSQL